jgi:heme exporter protein D
MDALGKFLHMGGYAAYVWPALGLTAAVMAALLVASLRAARRNEAELAELETDARTERRHESQA